MKEKSSVRTKPAPGDNDNTVLQAVVEKRRSLRVPLMVLEVKWKRLRKVLFGELENISMGGLFMSIERPLSVGEKFPVEFILPGEKTKISCTGEVTWTRPYAEEGIGSEGVGVRFVDLDGSKIRKIGQWMKSQEARHKKRNS